MIVRCISVWQVSSDLAFIFTINSQCQDLVFKFVFQLPQEIVQLYLEYEIIVRLQVCLKGFT